MLLLALGMLTACGGMFAETFSPPLELDGVWHLEWVETDGEREVPVLGQNTRTQPWVSFEDRINGNAGCNDFSSDEAYSYDYSAGVLVPGTVFQNAAGCHSEEGFDLHRMEEVLMGMLGNSPDGFEVSVDEDTMIWFSETTRLGFSRHEAPPEQPVETPPTSDPPPDNATRQSDALPVVCDEIEEMYPGANDLYEGASVVAEFSWSDGVAVLVRSQPDVVYFDTIECFTGGGGGLATGGPGEAWAGCVWAGSSEAGYTIVIVQSVDAVVEFAGQRVDLRPAADVAAALVEGQVPHTSFRFVGEAEGC